MQVELNREVYAGLAKLAYLGYWMANRFREVTEGEAFTEAQQWVLNLAQDMELPRWAEKDPDTDGLMPGNELHILMLPFIELYDEMSFWEELSRRLARRDLIERYGIERLGKLKMEDLAQVESSVTAGYDQEFEANGVSNLVIREGE